MDLHQAALAYAKRGVAVLPPRPRGKVPATSTGVKQATCNLAIIDRWWSAAPDLNPGINEPMLELVP